MSKVGRPRTNPVLKPDFWGRPLRKGDYVNYSIPGNHKGSGMMVFGEIIGKRQGYLELVCLADKYYEAIHCKHGYQVVRIPGDALKFVKSREEIAEEALQETLAMEE